MSSNELRSSNHEFRDWVKNRAQVGVGMVAGVLLVLSPYIIDTFTSSDEVDDQLNIPEDNRLKCGFDERTGKQKLLTLGEIEEMSTSPPVCVHIRSTGFIKQVIPDDNNDPVPTLESFGNGYMGPVGENAKE